MSILFCTPCYGGLAHAAHMRSCLALKEALEVRNVPHEWDLGTNESLVHRARMEMAAAFLATEHTHLFWLDADLEFTPEDVAAVWNMDAEIGVGVYVMKKPDQCWYAAWKDGALVKDLDQFKGPIEVDYAGTGFMCIKREVLERMHSIRNAYHAVAKGLVTRMGELNAVEAKVAEGMVNAWAPEYGGPNGRVPALFMTPIHNDGLESEDYHFCRMARDAGYKITMDPNVRLTHWGQYPYGKEHQGGNAAVAR